jgi:hypothetical protein
MSRAYFASSVCPEGLESTLSSAKKRVPNWIEREARK